MALVTGVTFGTMQRLACLLIVFAACGGGVKSEEASLTGARPTIKSSAAKPFTGPDGAGTMVLGWTIEMYEEGPGADCTNKDNNIVASIAIYTNQAALSKPQALLETGEVLIVPTSPPTVVGSAAATMGAKGVTDIYGSVRITEFHLLPDAMHADVIKGMINAGGKDDNGTAVELMGMFVAPVCEVDEE